MESREITPLIVIVGPTGSGKSELAINIAKKYNGEIICADSRTIYRGMDIGTAKPTKAEIAAVPHHLLDIVEPKETFTAAEFKSRALDAIDTITSRGKLAIMTGGTGLYVDGVIFDYAFLPPANPDERQLLQNLSVDELQQRLINQGIELPKNKQNPRHLIRAIETNGAVPVKKNFRKNTLVIGLNISKAALIERLKLRIDKMIDDGLKQEVSELVEKFGWSAPGMSAVGYKEWQESTSEETARDAILKNTIQYAKRQRTWFKRNPNIVWVKNSAEAMELVNKFLRD